MTLRHARLMAICATAVLVGVLTALSVLARIDQAQPAAAGAGAVPAPLAVGTVLQRPRPLPAVRLVDARGKPFALSAWRGRYVVLASTLTLCHEVCPMTTAALTALTGQLRQAGLANRVVVAEATVDPWRDTPARLRAYSRLTGADFTLLTGTPAQIHRLWKFLGVYYVRVPQGKPPDIDWLTHKPETFDVDHTNGLFVIDPAGQERVVEEGVADVGGRVSPALYGLLDELGRKNLAHPQLPWTANEVLDDLYNLMGRQLPANAVPKVTPPSPAAARQALAGSPGALGSLHQQAGRLLGSAGALIQRLHVLRGYPVVLNAWASWCGPCRSEFGIFASASAAYGKRVAFLGVNTNDAPGEARSFLAHHPVSYPSYQSSSTQLSPLAQLAGLPTTIFIDRTGKVVEVHAGQYDTQVALDNDVERYALGN